MKKTGTQSAIDRYKFLCEKGELFAWIEDVCTYVAKRRYAGTDDPERVEDASGRYYQDTRAYRGRALDEDGKRPSYAVGLRGKVALHRGTQFITDPDEIRYVLRDLRKRRGELDSQIAFFDARLRTVLGQ